MDLAVQNGAPFIGLNDSGGARFKKVLQVLVVTLRSFTAM